MTLFLSILQLFSKKKKELLLRKNFARAKKKMLIKKLYIEDNCNFVYPRTNLWHIFLPLKFIFKIQK